MTDDFSARLEHIVLWRDVQLLKRYGDEGAATRLKKHGSIPDVVAKVEAQPEPTSEELRGCDVGGEPLDPFAPWWGYQGPSSIEISARRRGLPWPPD